MQILLAVPHMAPKLGRWQSRPFWSGIYAGPQPSDQRDVHAGVVAWERPGEPEPEGPFRRIAEAIWRYDIFPPSLVTPVLRRRPVEVGDAVGTCYHFAPGVDLFFASRVIDRFDLQAGGVWKAGFTYATLEGHPMLGQETFGVEKDLARGRITVALRSWSRRQTLLARCLARLVRHLQTGAAHAALVHLEQHAAR